MMALALPDPYNLILQLLIVVTEMVEIRVNVKNTGE